MSVGGVAASAKISAAAKKKAIELRRGHRRGGGEGEAEDEERGDCGGEGGEEEGEGGCRVENEPREAGET